MEQLSQEQLERVGERWSFDSLMGARAKTKAAIAAIAANISPGMVEEDARQMAKEVLESAGSTRGWHKILVRFGSNTIKNFEEPSERGIKLGGEDIFFIDIGPVWSDTEGDGGKTFVFGSDPDMLGCSKDVESIFHIVRDKWLTTGMNG